MATGALVVVVDLGALLVDAAVLEEPSSLLPLQDEKRSTIERSAAGTIGRMRMT